MQSLHPMLRAGSMILSAVILVIGECGGAAAQSTKPPPQQLNLHDPTPRPPDLEQKYSTDPAEAARQEQLAAVKAAQIRQQVISATDKLLQLTQELQAGVAGHEKDTPMTPQVVEAEQIEKLAKTVKEKTKAQ